jgi:hypothetical protein
MNDGAPFEAKLQEHLLAVQAAAQAAKDRVAQGIAGLAPRSDPATVRPYGTIRPRSAVNFDAPTISVAAPNFDPAESEISDDGMDGDGIPVWEDET